MPKKKETIIEEDIEQLDQVEEVVEEKAAKVAVEPICLNCRFYSQGDLGPTCVNPESEYNGQRMREEDTCEVFTAKLQA